MQSRIKTWRCDQSPHLIPTPPQKERTSLRGGPRPAPQACSLFLAACGGLSEQSKATDEKTFRDAGKSSLPGREKVRGLCYTCLMIIGVSQITLHLPDSHSLKDKRQIVKSVIARVRNHFEVAIAEVEEQDRWQIAVIGVTCVSNSSQHANEVLGHVQRYIEETRPDISISDVETEIISW